MDNNLKFNIEHLNKTAEYASKALLTLNSGAFIASLGFAIKNTVLYGVFLVPFAWGLTFAVLLVVSNYFLFLLSTDTKNSGWPKTVFFLNKLSILCGLIAAACFLFGIWKIAFSF